MKPISTKHKIFLLGGLFAMVALVLVIVLTTGRHNQTSEPARTNAFAENETAGPSITTSNNFEDNVVAVSTFATSNPPQDAKPQANTAAAFIAEELAKGKKPNRLIHQKSPYLLQHAFNPVDWYPWGEEAFEQARKQGKPIFVSIGYSTCHWCHVMERESFDNPAIAAIMNQYFVSIKVDREERPDVDRVYMSATQALTGGGGWPMSVFLTHDLKPFYAGTYFPPDSRYGRPGFRDLLEAIHKAWLTNRQKILQSADQITAHLQQRTAPQATDANLTEALLAKAYNQIAASFDSHYGGFGNAPKFPRPVTFNFLLRYYHRSGEKKALEMTLRTLRKMAEGGMHDHIGGGFHRYSVDDQWRVPHFEKMLYDQAQLAVSYLEAYQITKEPFYAEVAQDILDYVLRDMTGPHGAFYSAEDADSPLPENPEEKGEGAFYVWTKKELGEILGAETGKIFNYYYGIEENGNALSDPHGEFTGKNILYVAHSLDETAKQLGKSPAEINKLLQKSRQKLFQVRATRPRPHLDDKVITSWNGLMIGAFARGYQALDEPRYLKAAERAASFIVAKLYDPDQKILLRRYRDGAAGLEAHLDDYAFLVYGLLDLYEAALDVKWLAHAIDLTEKQIALFWDKANGGFYDTSGKDETVLLRMKEDYDGAEPTGNSIAALNLLRLAQMTDNDDWKQKGAQTIATFADRLQQYPSIMPQMLAALEFQLDKPKQIIIAGVPEAADTQKMLREIHSRYLPNKIILLADGDEGQKHLSKYLPFIASVSILNGKATAYVCENYVCKLPTTDVAVMAGLLE
jgi:hypothetical protein